MRGVYSRCVVTEVLLANAHANMVFTCDCACVVESECERDVSSVERAFCVCESLVVTIVKARRELRRLSRRRVCLLFVCLLSALLFVLTFLRLLVLYCDPLLLGRGSVLMILSMSVVLLSVVRRLVQMLMRVLPVLVVCRRSPLFVRLMLMLIFLRMVVLRLGCRCFSLMSVLLWLLPIWLRMLIVRLMLCPRLCPWVVWVGPFFVWLRLLLRRLIIMVPFLRVFVRLRLGVCRLLVSLLCLRLRLEMLLLLRVICVWWTPLLSVVVWMLRRWLLGMLVLRVWIVRCLVRPRPMRVLIGMRRVSDRRGMRIPTLLSLRRL